MTPAHGSAPAGKVNSRGAEEIPTNGFQHTVRPLAIATAPQKDSKRWNQEEISWGEVLEWLDDPADHKECGNYLLGKLRGGRRTKDTIASRSALQLDADHAEPVLWDAVAALGVAALAHTTYSSKPGALRMRVIIPLNRDVTPDEYRHIARVVMHRLGWRYWDHSSDQPERYMFRPAAPPGELLGADRYSGPMLDADELLAEQLPAAEPAPRQSGAGSQGPDPVSAERYVLATVPTVLAELDELAQLAPQQRNDRGQGWEDASGIYHRAARLVELSNLAPEAYPLDQAHRDYMAHAPASYTQQAARKWDDAITAVGDRPAPLPDAAPTPTADRWEADVALALHRLQVQEEARKRHAARNASVVEIPPLTRLDQFLAEPDPEVAYRIDQVWPLGGRVVFSAQQKAGKTTTISNVLRSLADGDSFLGQFQPEQAMRLVLIDDELDARMLRRWLRDQGIANTNRIELVTLRGRLSTFNIMEEETRARWAQHIGPADVLLFDCLRPALDALGLDENHDAGRFLEAFDELITAAGIPEAIVVHHMGHGAERSRGDSRILDWPDAVWKLVRGENELANERFFSAYGRDVLVEESQLAYDATARRLSIVGGSRQQQQAAPAVDAVVEVLQDAGKALSKTAVETAVMGRGFGRNDARKAINSAVAQGLAHAEGGGVGRATWYSLPGAVLDASDSGADQ